MHTIRQVVDVVSQYAGTALPEPARNRVRGFILKLPQRWASKAAAVVNVNVVGERETVAAASGSGAGGAMRRGATRRAHRERGPESVGVKSGASSRAASPHASPRLARAPRETPGTGGGAEAGGGSVSHGAALVAAQRILTLATESLDMMRGVTGVVKDSLDRADAYVSFFSDLSNCFSDFFHSLVDGLAVYVPSEFNVAFKKARIAKATNSSLAAAIIGERTAARSTMIKIYHRLSFLALRLRGDRVSLRRLGATDRIMRLAPVRFRLARCRLGRGIIPLKAVWLGFLRMMRIGMR